MDLRKSTFLRCFGVPLSNSINCSNKPLKQPDWPLNCRLIWVSPVSFLRVSHFCDESQRSRLVSARSAKRKSPSNPFICINFTWSGLHWQLIIISHFLWFDKPANSSEMAFSDSLKCLAGGKPHLSSGRSKHENSVRTRVFELNPGVVVFSVNADGLSKDKRKEVIDKSHWWKEYAIEKRTQHASEEGETIV